MAETDHAGNIDVVTWAALLAHWTEFARTSAALPDTGEDGRWKRGVPHIITLHACAMALGELDRVDHDERPLALDRAEISCREAAGALHEIWRGEDLPASIAELINDARVAFELAANAGVEWLVACDRMVGDDVSALVAQLQRSGFRGELFVPTPGVAIFRGSPAAFARGPGGAPPTDEQARQISAALGAKQGRVSEPERISTPRQVYRQIDFATGRAERDVVVGMNESLPAGQPLLALAVEAGGAISVPAARGPALETAPTLVIDQEP